MADEQMPWWRNISAPLTHKRFAKIWFTSLISNFGNVIQAVGAFWLMTTMVPSPDMVSLVQTAASLPIALLAIVSGVSADIWNRRSVMLISQVLAAISALTLVVAMFAGIISPWILLVFTFLVGCGNGLFQPAWQSSVHELVPHQHFSAAIALDVFSINLARACGPALGGVIVFYYGSQTAFVINSLAYLGLIVAISGWKQPKTVDELVSERFMTAVKNGFRFAHSSKVIFRSLLFSAIFGFFGSPVWSLLPLVAKDFLNGDAGTYGVILAAFGSGAVLGALTGVSCRNRFSINRIVKFCAVGFGLSTVATAISSALGLTLVALFIAGFCWVATISSLNVFIQNSSPRWVVGRTVAFFHTCVIGGLAIGSYLWGVFAAEAGLTMCLVVSGSLMLALCVFPMLKSGETEGFEEKSSSQFGTARDNQCQTKKA